MKVYINADMDGIAGVNHPAPTYRADAAYGRNVDLMAGEVNAAIEGAFDGGATEVVVEDAHGLMFNLPPVSLDQRCLLMQGQKVWDMLEAVQHSSFDLAILVGCHARAGHPFGNISHSYIKPITLLTLNDRPVGEVTFNALVLGSKGVPVGVVTGDDAVKEEVGVSLPWAESVVVKQAAGRNAASSLHPAMARNSIRGAVTRAVQRLVADPKELRPFRIDGAVRLYADFANPMQADFASSFPGPRRVGDRGVEFVYDDPVEAYRALQAATRLVSLAD